MIRGEGKAKFIEVQNLLKTGIPLAEALQKLQFPRNAYGYWVNKSRELNGFKRKYTRRIQPQSVQPGSTTSVQRTAPNTLIIETYKKGYNEGFERGYAFGAGRV